MNFVSGIKKSESIVKSERELNIIYKQTITVDDIVYLRLKSKALAIVDNSIVLPTIDRASEIQVTRVPHVS